MLETDSQRLASFASSLDLTRADFAETDARVAHTFGVGVAISDGGSANFPDARLAGSIPVPSNSGMVLPEVSFGYILDRCCDLIVWVGGPDPREYVTKWIAGDVAKASVQAEAREHLGSASTPCNATSTRVGAASARHGRVVPLRVPRHAPRAGSRPSRPSPPRARRWPDTYAT